MGAGLPGFGVASGEVFFFGNSSRNLFSSSSVNPLIASDRSRSLAAQGGQFASAPPQCAGSGR